MTVKQFFKSTAFKCIMALLAILLVCGVFLTAMYGFLKVTEGEKLYRAVGKIYSGESVKIYGIRDGQEVEISKNDEKPVSMIAAPVKVANAEVSDVYKVTYDKDGATVLNYLAKSTGNGGFSNGTVTLWVAVTADAGETDTVITGINKIIIDSNVNQSFIGNIGSGFLDSFAEGYTDGIYYTTEAGYKVTGTSMSSNAICNAVNGAITCVDVNVLGHSRVNPFENFTHTDLINCDLSSYEVNDDNSVTYTIVTNGYVMAGAFTLEIVVAEDKTVRTFTIIKNGSTSSTTDDYKLKMFAVETEFAGKNLEYFTALMADGWKHPSSGELKTGATNSNYNCAYAAAVALENYDNCIAAKEGA